jgi:hypothetical protein
MAFPSVTNTFSNGTTADAAQVNTNFTDLINGFSDGTKDFNMNAGTLAGAFTCNGNVTLGNGTGDDITITGSLAATLNIKTTNLFDIGSVTKGLQAAYFGSSGGAFTTKVQGSAVTANKTFTLPGFNMTMPATEGSAYDQIETDGAGTTRFENRTNLNYAAGYSIGASVGASALTITLEGADDNALSATNSALFAFRDTTLTTGIKDRIEVTSDLTLVISSGSTLGHTSAVAEKIYVYVINNAGTPELAVSSKRHSENIVHTTVAEGGGGAADSFDVIYSETLRSNVAIKCIGYMESTQATAGTWASAMTVVCSGFPDPAGQVDLVQDYTTISEVGSASQQKAGHVYDSDILGTGTDLAYYKFASGAMTTDEEGTYTLSAGGTPTNTTGIDGADFAVSLDGSTDYYTQGTLLDAPSGLSNGIGISTWIQADDGQPAANSYICTKWNDVTGGTLDAIQLYLTTTGQINFSASVNEPSSTPILSSTNLPDGATGWYHIAINWDTSNGIRLWINGVLEASDSTKTTLMSDGTTRDFIIGATNGGGAAANFWDGKIGHFQVHDIAYTQKDIDLLYSVRYTAPSSFINNNWRLRGQIQKQGDTDYVQDVNPWTVAKNTSYFFLGGRQFGATDKLKLEAIGE